MNSGRTLIRVCSFLGLAIMLAGSICIAQEKPDRPATIPVLVPERIKEQKPPPRERTPDTGAPESARQVTIDFDNVDIHVFIKYISELTGRNFVIDKAVRGNVSIISPTRITVEEAFQVFESVLEVQGYTAVPAGRVTKIVPVLAARSKGVATGLHPAAGTDGDTVVTQIIPLTYADPDEIKKLIAPLVSKTSVVAAYAPTGMLLVTDVLSNIKRLLRIIERLDVPATAQEITVLPLQHAVAGDVADTLATVFQQGATARSRKSRDRGTGSQARILADARTNSLIVMAGATETAKIQRLVGELDRVIPRNSGNNHVYYLQHAVAEDLAKMLVSLPAKEEQGQGKEGGAAISKNVQIVADKATNSLVITANAKDYLALEEVIRKLDIPRQMVYIEALLMEVNVEKDFQIGMELLGGFTWDDGERGAFWGTNSSDSSILSDIVEGELDDLSSGLSLGVVGDIITIGEESFPSIGAVLNAYKGDGDVHIISTPQILTTDNQEAVIKVGENVPYLTKEADGDQNYETYEYKDVGVTLKITPQINQEGTVRMEIFQEIIKLKSSDEYRPTTLTRSAETTVIVRNNSTVVIGGIIGDDNENVTEKVPYLGDIPLFGWLFKTKTNTRLRTNLFIFLTPHIVRNPVEIKHLSEQKKNEMEREYRVGSAEDPLASGPLDYFADDLLLAEQGFQELQQGDYAEAKKHLSRALALNPENPYALINMGVVYEAAGEMELAADMYERVLDLDPDGKAAAATNPEMVGRPLVEIARDNLETIRKQSP